MPSSARIILYCVGGLLACGQTACNVAPQWQLSQSQNRAMALYQQNQSLAAQNQQTEAERNALQQQLADLKANQNSLQQRVSNLQNERQDLQQRYAALVNRSRSEGSPLSEDATRQFEDLAKRYPEFDFDPQTGVSKFSSDVVFLSGSAEVKPDAVPVLREFVGILNNGDSQRLNILVVGHTDNKPIAKPATRAKHVDNWDLSVHRATAVTRILGKAGLADARMGVAGYGPHQPLVPNTDENNRRKNRRVEIFVLAPNAAVAGWDGGGKRK